MINAFKRIISVLITISSVVQLCAYNLAFAAGEEYKDPYKPIYMSEFDGDNYFLPANFGYRDGFGSNTSTGHYVAWKDVNFDKAPVSVELSYGTMHSGAVAEIRIDSMTGRVIATFTPEPTGNMFTEGIVEVNVQQEVTGVHDLYFIWKTNYLNIKYLKFKRYGEDNLGYSLFGGLSEDVIYDDIDTNSLSYEIKILNKLGMLGFIQDTKFDGKKTVTKADFAQALCGFYTDEVVCDESYFYDLPTSHTKSKYVGYLYQKGIIDMTVDAHFKPDATITTQQALNAIKKIFNLPKEDNEIIAMTEKNIEKTILLGVAGKLTDDLTRQNLVLMLSNAMEATYITYQQNDTIDFGLHFTEGILKETRNINKTSGLINAVPSTSLSNVESGLRNDEVLLDGTVYKDPKGLAGKYLGYNCVVFYEEDDDELIVEAIYPKNNVSETIIDTTKGDELEIFSQQVIEYKNKDEITKKINLAKTVYFVYNGKAIDETIDRFVDVNTFTGTVRIINNRDSMAVLIDEYQNALLECIDSSKFKYLDKITDTVYDFSDDNTTVYKNSRPIMSGDIPQESAAYIYRSKNSTDSKLTRIVIIENNELTGIVSSIDEDKIIIDSTEYKIAKENKNTYPLGFFGTFVLNTYNEIIWGEKVSGNELQLGIFLGYRMSEIEEKVMVRLSTGGDNVESYECTQKFILDGVTRNEVNEIANGKNEYKGLVDVNLRTPVMFMLNEDNRLAVLDTYHEGRKARYDSLVMVGTKQKYRFLNSPRILVEQGNGYGCVPFETESQLISFWAGADDSCIEIEPFWNQISSIEFPVGQAYSTKGNEKIANIFVWSDRERADTGAVASDFILFDRIIKTLDPDELPARAIIGYIGKEKVTRFISDQSSVDAAKLDNIMDNLKRGDYIYVSVDPKNNITDIEVNYFCDGVSTRNGIKSVLYKDNGGKYRATHDLSLNGLRAFCKVIDIEDKYMFVRVGTGSDAIEEVYALSSPDILKVEGGYIETGLTTKEVFNSDTYGADAVVMVSDGFARQIIIYE